ncbi:hypothetical protein SAMD00019534_067780, partial [Acytostelium subglobosum LB1]|uniref:hypothetical protein n=1 Tax=Acytostelium subglobosum LB1 TaxID=1410327 RepID=UPI000644CB77
SLFRQQLMTGSRTNLLQQNDGVTTSATSTSALTMQQQQRRSVSTWGIRFLLGFSVVGFMFFMRRWTPRQVSRIIKTFQTREHFEHYLPEVYKMSFDRSVERMYLTSFLASAPVGPLCVVGPDGAGKSHIVKQVISNRTMNVLVDMRQNAVISGDELLLSFVRRLGYLLPSDDMISSLFLKGDKKQSINVKEIIQGLDTIYLSLIKIKDKYKEVPLIVITNIEALPTSDNFTRFLDWCISVTDNKLANIVFLTSSQFVHFHLDAKESDIREYLHTVTVSKSHVDMRIGSAPHIDHAHAHAHATQSNTQSQSHSRALDTLINEKERLAFTQADIDMIMHYFGGQMRDIDSLVGLVQKGEPLGKVIEMFLSETTQKLGSMIDAMFQKANGASSDSDKTAIFERYLRHFKMLETLLERPYIPVTELIERVFHEQPEELEEYFKINMVYFWMRQQHTGMQLCSTDNTYEIFVSFSSPRVRHAVERIIKEHRYVLQRQSIEKFFKKTDLKDDRKELEEQRQELQEEYDKVFQRLENLVENSSSWIKFMGEERFDERRRYYLQKEDACLSKIDQVTQKLLKIEEDLDNL